MVLKSTFSINSPRSHLGVERSIHRSHFSTLLACVPVAGYLFHFCLLRRRSAHFSSCSLLEKDLSEMSSRGGGGKPLNTSGNNELSGKGKSGHKPSRCEIEELSHGVADVALDLPQDDGKWEVIARKSKNRAGSSSGKQWVSQSSNTKGWGGQGMPNNGIGGAGRGSGNSWPMQAADSKRPAGRGNSRPQSFPRGSESNYVAPQPVIHPPLENGWNWQSRAGSMQAKGTGDGQKKDEIIPDSHPANEVGTNNCYEEDNGDESDAMDDTDDELLSDEFDSDASEKSHGTRKMNKWFKKYFEIMDNLYLDDINDPARQWHCPACQHGPGSIDWYKGLQPLMTHAKTKGSRRARLHREFAEILEEELRRRGTSVVPAGEAFGKWKGIKDEENKDHEIIWPPMVVIMNTKLEQDENEKWIGMGNQELLDNFSSYAAVKARHSYGPQGHRGMSVLIFETSARGYLEAERLHKHFAEQGTHRDAWNHRGRVLFCPGGNRQLYGFIAVKEDLDIFNQHSPGKSKLKFEMRSYKEMVVNQIWKMSEDNQLLNYFKDKAAKERRNAESLQQTVGTISEKLCRTVAESQVVRQRTKMQHEENQEEMHSQEKFFKDQIQIIHESQDAKEEDFERQQQMEREKVQQLNENPSNTEEYRRRAEEIAKFIKFQDKEMDEFAAEKEILIKAHEENMVATRKRQFEEEKELKRKHFEKTLELEKEFDANLTRLMEKYSPQNPQ